MVIQIETGLRIKTNFQRNVFKNTFIILRKIFPKTKKMQCSFQSLNDCERSPNRTNLRLNFTEKREAVKERREKFRTAKYGSHQMNLIRKRLAFVMWLYDELQKLFDPSSKAIDVDIDEILDMNTDDSRISHLRRLLSECKRPPQDISKFIADLLDRANTL